MSQDECDCFPPAPVAAGGRADPGIMVFSLTCRVLYANKTSHHFLRRLNQRENGHSTAGAFPSSVSDLLDELLKSLEIRATNGDPEPLEARRLVEGEGRRLLLKGFGISDRLDIRRSRIVLTIQETSFPVES